LLKATKLSELTNKTALSKPFAGFFHIKNPLKQTIAADYA
jgi:hypothetical protein